MTDQQVMRAQRADGSRYDTVDEMVERFNSLYIREGLVPGEFLNHDYRWVFAWDWMVREYLGQYLGFDTMDDGMRAMEAAFLRLDPEDAGIHWISRESLTEIALQRSLQHLTSGLAVSEQARQGDSRLIRAVEDLAEMENVRALREVQLALLQVTPAEYAVALDAAERTDSITLSVPPEPVLEARPIGTQEVLERLFGMGPPGIPGTEVEPQRARQEESAMSRAVSAAQQEWGERVQQAALRETAEIWDTLDRMDRIFFGATSPETHRTPRGEEQITAEQVERPSVTELWETTNGSPALLDSSAPNLNGDQFWRSGVLEEMDQLNSLPDYVPPPPMVRRYRFEVTVLSKVGSEALTGRSLEDLLLEGQLKEAAVRIHADEPESISVQEAIDQLQEWGGHSLTLLGLPEDASVQEVR